MDEQSRAARGALYLMPGISYYSNFNKGNTADTHTHLHSNAHKHKRYGSQGSAGVNVLKKVFVQLAASETASYRTGPTVPACLIKYNQHLAAGRSYVMMKFMFYCAYHVHMATLDS